jgi:hypothetical protein
MPTPLDYMELTFGAAKKRKMAFLVRDPLLDERHNTQFFVVTLQWDNAFKAGLDAYFTYEDRTGGESFREWPEHWEWMPIEPNTLQQWAWPTEEKG